MNKTCSPQSGNALWFILIAVALLGLLTAVVSRSSSSVEQSGSIEQSRVKASALLRYALSIQAAIQTMSMNGVSENELDFSEIDEDAYDNTGCDEVGCEVFAPAGGVISYRTASEVLGLNSFTSNWVVNGSNRVNGAGCDDADIRCNELLLILTDIPDQICLQVNAIQNVTNPSNAPPRQNGVITNPPFTGTFSGNNGFLIGGTNGANESPELAGKTSGCVFDTALQKNVFYQVLVAR